MRKMQKIWNPWLLGAGLVAASNLYAAELAIIVHPDNPIVNVDIKHLKNLYLDKSRMVDGQVVVPLDQASGRASHDSFYEKVMGDDAAAVDEYWAKMMFSGKGTRPKAFEDDQAVIERVKKDKRSIGYVEKSSVTDGVKVIMSIP